MVYLSYLPASGAALRAIAAAPRAAAPPAVAGCAHLLPSEPPRAACPAQPALRRRHGSQASAWPGRRDPADVRGDRARAGDHARALLKRADRITSRLSRDRHARGPPLRAPPLRGTETTVYGFVYRCTSCSAYDRTLCSANLWDSGSWNCAPNKATIGAHKLFCAQ